MTYSHGLTSIQRILTWLLVGALLLAALPALSVVGQEPPPLYTFQECEQVDEAALRDELNRIAQATFSGPENQLDIARLVDEEWVLLHVDAVMDQEIDKAVQRVRQEEDYWNRVVSGWSTAKAEEFTTKVAAYAFGSEPFRAKIDELAQGVAHGLTGEIERISAQSASSGLLCVQEFIGKTYSATMMDLFVTEMKHELVGMDSAKVEVTVNPLLDSRQKSLAGIGVIIGTQIAKRLAKSLARRIAGKVTGRLVGKAATTIIPLAGWIIGGGLLIWDLVEAGNGSLAEIQTALKAPDVKAGIRGEVAVAMEKEVNAALPELARTVSNELYTQWIDFQRKYSRVLDLAESDSRFRSVLDTADVTQIYQLADIVSVLESQPDQPALLDETLADGQMVRLLNLPPSAMELLRGSASPTTVLAWADLAGSDLDRVVETNLHRLASPENFADPAALQAVLALADPAAIDQIMLLSPAQRTALLKLQPDRVRELLLIYDQEDLIWLTTYIQDLDPQSRNQLSARLLQEPALMPKLKYENIRRAVVESGNFEEALKFLADPVVEQSPIAQVSTIIGDTEQVLSGQVAWPLYLRKYVTSRNGLFLLAILALLVLLTLFWRRRGQTVHVTVNLPESRDPDGRSGR